MKEYSTAATRIIGKPVLQLTVDTVDTAHSPTPRSIQVFFNTDHTLSIRVFRTCIVLPELAVLLYTGIICEQIDTSTSAVTTTGLSR